MFYAPGLAEKVSPYCSVYRGCGGAGRNRVNRDTVFVKLGDRQSKGIDELILRINLGLIAHLFGIEVVGDTEHPMLRSRIPRMAGRVEFVERQERGSSGHDCALYSLLRHGCDGDILHLHVALLDLAADDLRDKVILV